MESALNEAIAQIERAKAAEAPVVHSFFDEPTNTATYVVWDPATRKAAGVDSVLNFDAAAGRTKTASADAVIAYVREHGLSVDWLLETHAHADHLSAAPYLQKALSGQLAIGREIIRVQNVFGKIFNAGTDFERDGSEFDRLFDDGDRFAIGNIEAIALHVPPPIWPISLATRSSPAIPFSCRITAPHARISLVVMRASYSARSAD